MNCTDTGAGKISHISPISLSRLRRNAKMLKVLRFWLRITVRIEDKYSKKEKYIMNKQKGRFISVLAASASCLSLMLAGCGVAAAETDTASETAVIYEETIAETSSMSGLTDESILETDTESDDEKLRLIASLPGMSDEDTKDLLGGSEENWSADKSYYIGRIFSTSLYGTDCQVNTTCSDDGTVESVSIWIVNGSRDVTQEEADLWIGRVSALMGSEPSVPSAVSEGGSQNYRWTADGNAATLYLMKDILSVSFQPAVGELK